MTTEKNRAYLSATGSKAGNDVRLTPEDFYDSLNAEFNFSLDACALPGEVQVAGGTMPGARCEKFYSPADDALSKTGEHWFTDSAPTHAVWMNPPYGRAIPKWIEAARKAADFGAVVVCLLPSRTGSKWFLEGLLGKYEVRFLKGRLTFEGTYKNSKKELVEITDPATFDSVVAVIRTSKNPRVLRIDAVKTVDRRDRKCKVYVTVDPSTGEIVFDPRTVKTSRFYTGPLEDEPSGGDGGKNDPEGGEGTIEDQTQSMDDEKPRLVHVVDVGSMDPTEAVETIRELKNQQLVTDFSRIDAVFEALLFSIDVVDQIDVETLDDAGNEVFVSADVVLFDPTIDAIDIARKAVFEMFTPILNDAVQVARQETRDALDRQYGEQLLEMAKRVDGVDERIAKSHERGRREVIETPTSDQMRKAIAFFEDNDEAFDVYEYDSDDLVAKFFSGLYPMFHEDQKRHLDSVFEAAKNRLANIFEAFISDVTEAEDAKQTAKEDASCVVEASDALFEALEDHAEDIGFLPKRLLSGYRDARKATGRPHFVKCRSYRDAKSDPVVDPVVDPSDPVVDPVVDPSDPVADPSDPVVDVASIDDPSTFF